MADRFLGKCNPNIAWLVGFLEGEGSFTRHKSTQTERIGVQGTDYDVLARAVRILGCGKVGGPLRRGPTQNGGVKDRKPIYWIQIHGLNARMWMRVLYPYMGQRRKDQIDKSLAHTGGQRVGQ